MASSSRGCWLVAAVLLASCLWPLSGRAQTQWTPVIEAAESGQGKDNTDPSLSWDEVPLRSTSSADLVWEPLTPEQASTPPEDLVWSEPTDPPLMTLKLVLSKRSWTQLIPNNLR